MNTSNNTQAQTSNEQTTTPAKFNNPEIVRLIDNVDNATITAISILKIMAGFFSECHGNLYDKDALYYTTQAVIEEIKKINAAVIAYEKTTGK